MMMDPGADNHVVHSRGTLSALTGRFFVTPLAKALARVGAGVAWMPGGGLYGRPPLEEARPITSPPHRAPTTDPTPPPVASAVHGRGDPLWSPCPMSSPSSLPSPCPEHSRKSHDIFHSPTLSKHEGAPRSAQRNRLYLYPPPKPLPHTPAFKLATTLVTLLTLLFSGYFIFYLTVRQNAYLTNAEDLGIMDQAIWNTLHGHLLHQSICNIVSDPLCHSF